MQQTCTSRRWHCVSTVARMERAVFPNFSLLSKIHKVNCATYFSNPFLSSLQSMWRKEKSTRLLTRRVYFRKFCVYSNVLSYWIILFIKRRNLNGSGREMFSCSIYDGVFFEGVAIVFFNICTNHWYLGEDWPLRHKYRVAHEMSYHFIIPLKL